MAVASPVGYGDLSSMLDMYIWQQESNSTMIINSTPRNRRYQGQILQLDEGTSSTSQLGVCLMPIGPSLVWDLSPLRDSVFGPEDVLWSSGPSIEFRPRGAECLRTKFIGASRIPVFS